MGVAGQLGARLGRRPGACGIPAGSRRGLDISRQEFRCRPRRSAMVRSAAPAVARDQLRLLGRRPANSVEAASPALPGSGRPNIVLIVMDTVHADHLAVNGYARDTTPNLRDLARDSVVYTNAISASDITLTSHASLFTGMYPSWHGAYCDPQNAMYGRAVSNHYPTLAELLRSGGYQTTGVAANLYLRADFGLERGFDRFRIPRPVPLLAAENAYHAAPQPAAGIEPFVRYGPVRSSVRLGRGYRFRALHRTRSRYPNRARRHSRSSTTWTHISLTCRRRRTTCDIRGAGPE